MTAPRAREQADPPSPPDRRPPRRGGGSSPSTCTASPAGRAAGPARAPVARHGLARSARALAAAALLALSGALALPATAQADVLVSNIGQSSSGTILLSDGDWRGQTFSIAAGSGDYTLSSIVIPFTSNGISSADMGSLTVAIWSTHASGANAGDPSSSLYTLTKPESIGQNSRATFEAPANSTLEAGKTYAVVVVYSKTFTFTSQKPLWRYVETGEDANPEPGWSIGDSYHVRGATDTSWLSVSGFAFTWRRVTRASRR